jgi:competence protein ComEC
MGGVVLLGPTISDTLTRRKLHPVLALPLAVSIAAQAATLPLVLAFFGRLPLVGLPATMTADLALLPLMITGIVAGIVGGLIPPLAPVLGLAVWPWAAWLLWWVEFWGSLPWASVEVGRPEPWVVASYYVALGGLLWLAARRRRKRLYAEGNSQ